jgi:hypothetical protein
VARRIDIELTSARPDGTWTWRAAGARQPRGVLAGELLHDGAKVGDTLRAEADFDLEGIVILSVAAPRDDRRREPERIEVIGVSRPDAPGVTTQLVGRRDGRRRDRPDRADRGSDRPSRPRSTPTGGPRQGSPARTADEGAPAERSAAAQSRRPDTRGRPTRRSEPRSDPATEGGRQEAAGNRPAAPRRRAGRSEERSPSTAERGRVSGVGGGRGPAERGRRRLNPSNTHRRAVLDSLPPEQLPVAEQLLRGGIPAVRTALHLEREKAETEGRPAPNPDALLALAESLLPRLRAAEWRDRAEAAVAAADDISLRDLRSVAAGADLARDDQTRELASRLREAVEARLSRLHSGWEADIAAQLDAGRVVRAVRLSARPPDPAARLGDELTARLVAAANEVLSPSSPADLWASMLEAVAASPVRRLVSPAGLPADAPPELKRAAHQYSGSVPALARLLGVAIPPPPVPVGARPRPAPPHPRPLAPSRSEADGSEADGSGADGSEADGSEADGSGAGRSGADESNDGAAGAAPEPGPTGGGDPGRSDQTVS